MSGIESRADEARRAQRIHSNDVSAMTLALALGRRGLGQCWPNPSVGVVIADSGTGQIVGGAWTARGGRPHAEAIALASAGTAARGATLYTTLEPCSHWGKTPPCADAVLAAGLKRLVYGIVDPDPRVAGQGLDKLRHHGVEVVEGPLPRQAAWLAVGHALRVGSGRPFIQLKLAVDANGLVPAGNGAPQFVSSVEARGFAHLLRAETDAILVGSGTLRADDPDLTCRLPGLAERSPIRVIFSSDARLPLNSKMLRSAAAHPIWIICAEDAEAPHRAELERLGVVLIPVPRARDGRLDIRMAMSALADRGITRVLVEGGPTLAAGFLSAGLIDEALVIHAAALSRGDTIRPFGQAGIAALRHSEDLHPHAERRIGPDRLSIYRRAEF